MPNTIRNVIRFTGDTERIKQVLESVKADDHGIGSIDFNKILKKLLSRMTNNICLAYLTRTVNQKNLLRIGF